MSKAKQLDKRKVVAGDFVPVENKKWKVNEKKIYRAVWVEDSCGGNERCLLVTNKEALKLRVINPCSIMDKMKAGTLYDFGKSFIVKIEIKDNNPIVVYMPKSYIVNGEKRAKRNPEDIPKKGFLTNLFD